MAVFSNFSTGMSNALNNDSNNNNVGYAVNQMNADQDPSDRLAAVLANTIGKPATGRFADTSLGQGFYNSPPYIAMHYTNLGRFFTGAEPGNFYTNRFKQPQQGKPPQSTDPVEFNNRWYQRMREFAQADEIAARGQPNIRSR